jgi:serine/threonine-protein kinase
MSPEQATGDQVVGPASDTYALACVLYEMLVGEPPYPGNTAQAVLGKIIQGTPVSATAIRKAVPANVDAAIRKALEKLPADRFTGAQEFAKALGDSGFRHGEMAGVTMAVGRWSPLTSSFAAAAVVGLGAAAFTATRPTAPAPVIRYSIMFAEEQVPTNTGQSQFGTSLTLSDDGSRLVYVGTMENGTSQLWLRERHQFESRPLPGTDEAHQPALSPDGTHVAYITAGSTRELKTASLGGEPPLTLVSSDVYRLGAAWGNDGYVYFCQQPSGGLARVPERGGDIELVSTPDAEAGETRHAWPDLLPNGKGVLVTVQRGNNIITPEDDVGVLDLETGEVRVLFRGLLARYATTGHLVFVTHEGDLRAAPFDQDKLEVTGPAVPLMAGMPVADRGPDVALSRSGRLIYSPLVLSAVQEVVWVDRNGGAQPVEQSWTLTPELNGGPALSPDEQSIAISIFTGGGDEVWVKRIGGPFSRLAFEAVSQRPHWSPDGRSVMYTSLDGGDVNLMVKRADGSGGAEFVVDLPERTAWDGRWSSDGQRLVFRTQQEPTRDIFGIQPGENSEPVSLVVTDFEETSPVLSPDGRFLAYMSDESGSTEIYVRPFPNVNDAKTQVSTDGGREPLWAHSGRELFYKNSTRELVSVSVTTDDGFRVVERRALFDLPVGSSYNGAAVEYDISRDDQRFLMLRSAGATNQQSLGHYMVVENFLEELLQRVEN